MGKHGKRFVVDMLLNENSKLFFFFRPFCRSKYDTYFHQVLYILCSPLIVLIFNFLSLVMLVNSCQKSLPYISQSREHVHIFEKVIFPEIATSTTDIGLTLQLIVARLTISKLSLYSLTLCCRRNLMFQWWKNKSSDSNLSVAQIRLLITTIICICLKYSQNLLIW